MSYPNAIEVCRAELFTKEVELRERYPQALVDKVLRVREMYNCMVEKFADGMNTLIRQILGHSLATGDWCIVTSPSSTKSLCFAKNRRHKERNFASLISARLAELLGIPFYEDVAECYSLSRSAWLAKNHRVGAVFTFGSSFAERLRSKNEPPTERNIIVFDDFVTTGATMISMKNLLEPLGKKLVFFTGINNKA